MRVLRLLFWFGLLWFVAQLTLMAYQIGVIGGGL